jgi:PAS domain S-box-containing protein
MSVTANRGLSLPDLLGRISDYTQDVILITEADPVDQPGPRIVYVNAAFTHATGYRPEEVIGLTPRILQGPNTSRESCARIRAALQAWQPIRIELLNYRKDGSEFWVELSITPVADETGWFRYWVSVQRETNERRYFDEQRRLYELVLANVDEGILVADALRPDCPIEYVNAGFSRMTGYAEAELLGRNCRLIQGSNTDPEATRRLGLAIKQQQPVTVELLNYRKDGSTFWNLTSITPLRNAQGDVVKYVGVQHDLTDAKLREQQMVAAQRLKAVGEMTGGIAHDFNNLLTAISGAAELLAKRLATDPESAPLVEAIRGAAQRGAGQVRRLMGFSRTPMLARGRVDLIEVLQQLELLLARSLRDNISLHIDIHADARWVDAEAAQLEGALLNLVFNAQDAIADAGCIGITTQCCEVDGRPMARVEVSDTGVGMDDATIARIFTPFFTTKGAGRGSGLGLAMVHAFATQLGGTIEARSRPGQGSVFALTLPAAEHGDSVFDTLDVGAVAPCHAYRVLVVEDDDVVRTIALAMLESLGHRVQACGDADQALDLLGSGLHFDVLFTDLMMPGSMGGLALAAVARKRQPRLAVILTSGWADSDLPAQPATSDAHRFVMKPYTLDDLRRAFTDVSR